MIAVAETKIIGFCFNQDPIRFFFTALKRMQ